MKKKISEIYTWIQNILSIHVIIPYSSPSFLHKTDIMMLNLSIKVFKFQKPTMFPFYIQYL